MNTGPIAARLVGAHLDARPRRAVRNIGALFARSRHGLGRRQTRSPGRRAARCGAVGNRTCAGMLSCGAHRTRAVPQRASRSARAVHGRRDCDRVTCRRTPMILRNSTTGTIIADKVHLARNLWSRAAGLITRAAVAEYEGLWLPRCRAIHTFGMRTRIDVFFMDETYRVVQQHECVAPNRLLVGPPNARHTVELGASPNGGRDVMSGHVLPIE